MTLADRIVTWPLLRAADQVVFISATSREAFAGVALRRPAQLAFNGVDHAIFHDQPPAGERAMTRAALGIDPAAPMVLFVGRLVRKKGVAIVRLLAEACPDIRFVLAGRGPIMPEQWELSNVTVVRDRAGATLAAVYRSADALVLPSYGEGFPLVVQEAMACGLPVLCDTGSTRADPDAGRWLRGVAVDPQDEPATAVHLAAALDAVLASPPDRTMMAAHARQHYNWGATARTIAAAAIA